MRRPGRAQGRHDRHSNRPEPAEPAAPVGDGPGGRRELGGHRVSIDTSRTPNRTLVCYKETHANAKIDPHAAWTGTSCDPRFSPPSDGRRPENALTGTIFTANDGSRDRVTVPTAEGRMRFWRNTGVATLGAGQVATLTNGSLTALADGVQGPNGVYAYGNGGVFPTDTWFKSNYWADIVFER